MPSPTDADREAAYDLAIQYVADATLAHDLAAEIVRLRDEAERRGLERAAAVCDEFAAEHEEQRKKLRDRRRHDGAGIRADQRDECARCAACQHGVTSAETSMRAHLASCWRGSRELRRRVLPTKEWA